MRVVGISAYYHDAAAALVCDGEIVAAAQEERFTRRKHDSGFPRHALEYCLSEGGIRLDQVDLVAFYDKPLLKFERLLETYLAFAPRGFESFRMAIPIWLREKLFLKNLLQDQLKQIRPDFDWAERLVFSEHHLSHAASAFFPSPYASAAVLTPLTTAARAAPDAIAPARSVATRPTWPAATDATRPISPISASAAVTRPVNSPRNMSTGTLRICNSGRTMVAAQARAQLTRAPIASPTAFAIAPPTTGSLPSSATSGF